MASKIIDEARDVMRKRHYSIRTEATLDGLSDKPIQSAMFLKKTSFLTRSPSGKRQTVDKVYPEQFWGILTTRI